jgi:thioredoxin-like negative regulator of GroEL
MAWSMRGPRRATATRAVTGFDQRLVDHLADKLQQDNGIDLRKAPHALQRLFEAVERAKTELNSVTRTQFAWRAQPRQKVDIDRSPALAQRFQVMAVPTLVLLDTGVEMPRAGVAPAPELRRWVEETIAGRG